MRRLSPLAVGGAVLAATFTVGGVGQASPPDGDGNAEALARFEGYAESQGYSIIDPVCVETDEPMTFVCYAITETGEPLVAQTTLDGDVDEWELIEGPGEPTGSTADSAPGTTEEPNVEPASAEPAVFDPLAFFAGLFSADPGRIAEVVPFAQPGSPAEAYASFQRQYVSTAAATGNEVTPSYVYLTTDGIRVCVTADSCFEIGEIEVVDDQVVTFAVDGNDIAPRLARPGQPVAVGAATVHLTVAYQTVSGGQLVAYLEISSNNSETFELSTAVYVDADGNQTPVDLELSFGAVDTNIKGTETVLLSFPGAEPGGEVRFLVHPADGSGPLAAVIPVTAFAVTE